MKVSARHSVLRIGSVMVLFCGLIGAVVLGRSLADGPMDAPEARQLPPFLDMFQGSLDRPVTMAPVSWPTALGPGRGHLARLEGSEPRPAIVVMPDSPDIREWHRQSARELASIGYVVLLVDWRGQELPGPVSGEAGKADPVQTERVLAHLTAAVRWLRRRDDVLPGQVGTVGWSAGGYWATVLAAEAGLQAAVNCAGPVPNDPAVLSGLRECAVMVVWTGERSSEPQSQEQAARRRQLEPAAAETHFLSLPEATERFMEPGTAEFRSADAERAWFEIYEFLDEHVEDAPLKELHHHGATVVRSNLAPAAAIADLMRAVNAPTGVRGQLIQALNQPPQNDKAWKEVEARASLLVETGHLLLSRTPPRGTSASWQKQVLAYRVVAERLNTAVERRDYSAAQRALQQLQSRCSACHLEHR